MIHDGSSVGMHALQFSRRRWMSLGAAACGSLVVGGRAIAAGKKVGGPRQEAPCKLSNAQLTSLHQEVDLPATPARVYHALLDSKEFTAFSGMPAEIDGKAGGAFSLFAKIISGRFVELVPDKLVVQAWGDSGWGANMYSIAKFELKPSGAGTHLVLDHTGFPEKAYDHLYEGWGGHYWEPLKAYFAKG
jgi:activator of HSP90 ATPase